MRIGFGPKPTFEIYKTMDDVRRAPNHQALVYWTGVSAFVLSAVQADGYRRIVEWR